MESSTNKKLVLYTLGLTGLLVLLNDQIAEEIVFPANVAYSVLTFYLTYSESHVLRHYVTSFLLSFCEVFYITLIKVLYRKATRGVDPFKSDFLVLFFEFSVVFIAIRLMNKKEVYLEFSDSILRTCVFVIKGFYKARAIVITLRIMTGSNTVQITQEQFLMGVVSTGIISVLPAVIYLIDTFLCSDVPVSNIDLEGVTGLAKVAVTVSAISLIVELFVPPRWEILIGSSISGLTIYLFYLVMYMYDSYNYSKHFSIKVENSD